MVTPCRRAASRPKRLRRQGADRRTSTAPDRESHSVQHDGGVFASSTAIDLSHLLDDQTIDRGTVAEERPSVSTAQAGSRHDGLLRPGLDHADGSGRRTQNAQGVPCSHGAVPAIIGRRTTNVLPWPSRLSTSIVPPCCWTMSLAPARPNPDPGIRPTTLPARWKR